MARPKADSFTRSYESDLKYWLGENHWPTSKSFLRNYAGDKKNQSVRNYTFATIDHKASVVLDATPRIHVEPLIDAVTFTQRQEIASAVRHELERIGWDDIAEDVFLDGCVGGTGIAMCRTEKDDFTGEDTIFVDVVDPRRFYPDPEADRLSRCKYVVYEPEMDMGTIRRTFPESYQKVKATGSTPITTVPDEKRARTDTEIVYGAGTEVTWDDKGRMQKRTANVCFVWIKSKELSEDIQMNVISGPQRIGECPDCGVKGNVSPDSPGETPCPMCGNPMEQTDVPPITEQNTVIQRMYPFGRLIVYSGDTLLYDGPNPYELTSVFPFAVYTHYKIPRRFHGYGDVALLKSLQMTVDKNMSQLLDAMRLMSNGPFEYPAEAEAYTNLGNSPGQMVPVPLPLMGKARWVSPTGFNGQMFQMADESNIRDFQRVSGISDVSTGTSPTAPTSGVEVQARQRAAATRVGKQLKALNKFRGDLASLVWQVMQQFYIVPRTFMQQMPTSEQEAIELVCAELPKGVAVKVDADVDAIERDKLMGQNIMMLMTQPNPMTGQPIVPPMLDLLLPALGLDPVTSREIQARVNQIQMQQMAMQEALGPANVATPPGAPPDGTDQGQGAGASSTDQAYAAMNGGGRHIPFQRGE